MAPKKGKAATKTKEGKAAGLQKALNSLSRCVMAKRRKHPLEGSGLGAEAAGENLGSALRGPSVAFRATLLASGSLAEVFKSKFFFERTASRSSCESF